MTDSAKTSISPKVNIIFRKHICPLLRESWFQRVTPRNSWCWVSPAVHVFHIHSVGSYFSDVTGWPPCSVSSEVGVYYECVGDQSDQRLKRDSNGRPLPTEYQCHYRLTLERSLGQEDLVSRLKLPQDRARRDIWWIERDVSNAEEVAKDIAQSFLKTGIRWFKDHRDLSEVLQRLERERDCYNKFEMAMYMARFLGNSKKEEEYLNLMAQEAKRVNFRGRKR